MGINAIDNLFSFLTEKMQLFRTIIKKRVISSYEEVHIYISL